MGTFSTIQTRVNRRVIDLPSAVVAEVPDLVKQGHRELQNRHNFKVMEAELSAYTTINQRGLVVSVGGSALSVSPTTWKEPRGEPWWVQYADGRVRPMSYGPSREAMYGLFGEAGASVSDVGFPRVVLEGMPDTTNARALQVYPLPDGLSDYPDGEYRITIPYWRYLPDLSAAGDSDWFTTDMNGEMFIVQWATAKAFELDWDVAKQQEHLALAEVEFKMITQTDKRARLAAVRTFVPHWRGVHENMTRL